MQNQVFKSFVSFLLLATLRWECQASDAVTTSEAYDRACDYTARVDAPNRSENQIDYDWDRYERCARLSPDGRMLIDPAHVERIRVKDGLASLWVESGGWYYVRQDGASLSVISFDNSPDPWAEGFVRGRREGKIVYFNRQFEEATGTGYDWAWPFENGHALVCEGCVLEDSTHEHRALVGGSWWFVDPAGDRVEPEDLSEDEIARLEHHSRRGRLR